jgi:hypothetical protein
LRSVRRVGELRCLAFFAAKQVRQATARSAEDSALAEYLIGQILGDGIVDLLADGVGEVLQRCERLGAVHQVAKQVRPGVLEDAVELVLERIERGLELVHLQAEALDIDLELQVVRALLRELFQRPELVLHLADDTGARRAFSRQGFDLTDGAGALGKGDALFLDLQALIEDAGVFLDRVERDLVVAAFLCRREFLRADRIAALGRRRECLVLLVRELVADARGSGFVACEPDAGSRGSSEAARSSCLNDAAAS